MLLREELRGYVMPGEAGLDAPGALHHVMIRGIERKNIVDDDKDRRDLVSRMGDPSSETGTAIYAWTLLKNHAHILLRIRFQGFAVIHHAS